MCSFLLVGRGLSRGSALSLACPHTSVLQDSGCSTSPLHWVLTTTFSPFFPECFQFAYFYTLYSLVLECLIIFIDCNPLLKFLLSTGFLLPYFPNGVTTTTSRLPCLPRGWNLVPTVLATSPILLPKSWLLCWLQPQPRSWSPEETAFWGFPRSCQGPSGKGRTWLLTALPGGPALPVPERLPAGSAVEGEAHPSSVAPGHVLLMLPVGATQSGYLCLRASHGNSVAISPGSPLGLTLSPRPSYLHHVSPSPASRIPKPTSNGPTVPAGPAPP